MVLQRLLVPTHRLQADAYISERCSNVGVVPREDILPHPKCRLAVLQTLVVLAELPVQLSNMSKGSSNVGIIPLMPSTANLQKPLSVPQRLPVVEQYLLFVYRTAVQQTSSRGCWLFARRLQQSQHLCYVRREKLGG